MPAALVASRVAFAHAGGATLLSNVDFRLENGLHGVVGANGSGKTTLLRLLTGALEPDEGHVRALPAGARVVLCEQRVDDLTDAIRAFASSDDRRARSLRGALELDGAAGEQALARWPTLSPGERKRFQIGAALAADPDVLLLDEPTNHLDVDARRLLVEALRRFGGVGLIVSHDRAMLDELTSSTVRVHAGEVRVFPGGYSHARATWEGERDAELGARDLAVRRAGVAKKQLTETRARRDEAAAELSTGRRVKGPKDHDGRNMLAKVRVEWAEARLARRVNVARAAASRAAGDVPAFEVDKALGRSVFVGYEPPPRDRLLAFAGDVRAGEEILLRGVDVEVRRGARVRVEGANGSGKTTLLDALVATSSLPPERVLRVPQDVDAARAALEVRALRDLDRAARGRVLSIVAALGVDPDRLLATRAPSPGEAKKLAIARGLAAHAWVAILDEPENHLDVPSIERLEAALRSFPGALVVVTHDASFLQGELQATWRVHDGSVGVRG